MKRIPCLLSLLASALSAHAAAPASGTPPGPPPPAVTWVNPRPARVAETREFPARLAARDEVELRARVAGHLESATFVEGGRVTRGQVLFQLDARPFELEVRRAEAELSRARSHRELKEAEAARATLLTESNAISGEERESRTREAVEAAASEKIAVAQVAVAKLDLSYAQITAPVDGRIGTRRVSPGNFIPAGSASPVLAVIVTEDPLHVWFDVDESAAARWRAGGGVTGSLVRVRLSALAGPDRDATLDFLGPTVDDASGTLRFRAVLPNADGHLAPGMHARVTLALESPQSLLTIPEKAVGSDLGRPFVWVVDAEGHAQHRKIITGPQQGGMRAIREGLAAEDRVLVGGLMAVRPNLLVKAEPEAPAP